MRMVPATHLHSMGPMGLGGRWRRRLRLMKSGAGQTQVENWGSQRYPKRLLAWLCQGLPSSLRESGRARELGSLSATPV